MESALAELNRRFGIPGHFPIFGLRVDQSALPPEHVAELLASVWARRLKAERLPVEPLAVVVNNVLRAGSIRATFRRCSPKSRFASSTFRISRILPWRSTGGP